MGNGTVTPWNVLSDAITKRVQASRDRAQKAKDQETQTEYKAWEGVLTNPASTEDERNSALEHMKKTVPKETIPIVEAYHKAVSLIHRRKKGQTSQSGQSPSGQPAQAPAAPPAQAQPAQPSQPGQPPSSTPQPAQSSAAGGATGLTLPSVLTNINKRAPGMAGTAEGQYQAATDQALSQGRMATLKALREQSSQASEGKGLPKELDNALSIWAATGQMPSSAMTRPKMHPVTVVGPDGVSLVPGMEDDSGNVWANGVQVEDPKVMPKWKPRHGYAKDGAGKFFSFAIDPQTNQPVPGSEDYQELPPSGYLEHVRTGFYHWTDDSGAVHESPFTATSFSKTPSNMEGKATPAVPPAFAKLPKPKSGTSAGTTSPNRDKVLGTKDTGVLSPAGQKVLMTTDPVVKQARKLEKIFEDHPELKTNDQAGYLLLPYIAYRLGYATEGALESEIAGLSLGSVIEAASVLQGTSRSITALKLAMVHTPNAKSDSPKNIYRKLHNDIIPRLDDVMDAAKKYGRKRATTAVPDSVKGPSKSTEESEDEKFLLQLQ